MLRCPRCQNASIKKNIQLLNAKGFATVTCRRQDGGCGARTSALHWQCRCEADSRWYKCPTHSQQQLVVAHRQNRKATGAARRKPSNQPDLIPVLPSARPRVAPKAIIRHEKASALIRPNAASSSGEPMTNELPVIQLKATLCSKLAATFPHRLFLSVERVSNEQLHDFI